jgi:hypothetical protein
MVILVSDTRPSTLQSSNQQRGGETMKSVIVLAACVLATSSTSAAEEKSKVTAAKLEGKGQVVAGKTLSKPAVATESPICDYSVETDCR